MNEGQQVRVAMNGPDVDHDALLDFSAARNDEDRRRASSAGESRAKIKEFLDETGFNGKALGWLRSILKLNDRDDGQAKAMDVIMSMEKGLPMIKAHVAGQGQGAMDFDEEPAAEPVDDSLPKPSYQPTFAPGRDAELDQDSDDFDRQLAAVG